MAAQSGHSGDPENGHDDHLSLTQGSSKAVRVASDPAEQGYYTRLQEARPWHSSGYRLEGLRPHHRVSTEDFKSSHDLRAKVFTAIRRRLQESGYQLSGLSQGAFSWLLPKNDANIDHWKQFLENPVSVDDALLETMLTIRQSTHKTSPDPEKSHIFYFRTFSFDAGTLANIFEQLFDDDFDMIPDSVLRILERLATISKDSIVHVRYCGHTSLGTAYQRHYNDVLARLDSFLGRFLEMTRQLAPQILAAVRVYELKNASIWSNKKIHMDHCDERERALIALFGESAVFNTQAGGELIPYNPPNVDEDQFLQLRTNGFWLLESTCQPASDRRIRKLEKYAAEVKDYSDKHCASTGADSTPISLKMQNIIAQQAIPVTVDNFCPLLIIGSDGGKKCVQEEMAFLEGRSRSSSLCVNIINQLAAWETSNFTKVRAVTAQFVRKRYLPFVDLYPWARKDIKKDFEDAAFLLRSALRTIKPLIALTFGDHVSSVAIGAFRQAASSKEDDLGLTTGKLHLSHYIKLSDTDADNGYIIVVPCIHPGLVGHKGKDAPVFARLIGKVFAKTWLVMCIAIQTTKRRPQYTKKQICEEVIHIFNTQYPPDHPFNLSIDEVRQETLERIHRYLQQAKRIVDTGPRAVYLSAANQLGAQKLQLSTPSFVIDYKNNSLALRNSQTRWSMAESELYAVLDCGRASPDASRNIQVAELVDADLALLISNFPSRPTTQAYRSWLKSINEGDYYYLQRTNAQQRANDIPNLLSVFLPQDISPVRFSVWKSDQAAVDVASSYMQIWVEAHLNIRGKPFEQTVGNVRQGIRKLMQDKEPNLHKELLINAGLSLANVTYDPNFRNGCQVNVVSDKRGDAALLDLRWMNENNIPQRLNNFRLPAGCIPLFSTDRRFLELTDSGLNIRDSDNRILGLFGGQRTTMSIHRIHAGLGSNSAGHPFLSLWERVTGVSIQGILHPDNANTGTISALTSTSTSGSIPANFFDGLSRPWNSRQISKEKKKEEAMFWLPLQPGDALWLLHKFLLQEYPQNGAIVDAASMADWPEIYGIWARLKDFLRRPKYRHHPQNTALLHLLDDSLTNVQTQRKLVASLGAYLEVIRTNVEAEAKASHANKQHRRKMWFRINGGPPAGLINESRPEPVVAQETEEDLVALEPDLETSLERVEEDDEIPLQEEIAQDEDDEMLM